MITQSVRKISIYALTITLLGSVAACTSHSVQDRSATDNMQRQTVPAQSSRSAPRQVSRSMGQRAAAVAMAQVGVPYRYGGASRTGFDCSGLVHFSYREVGKPVARTTGQLWSTTTAVRRSDMQVGDLLFFNIEGKMSHVGMYIGDAKFVHAPSSGRSVTVATLDSPYYSAAFLRAGRPK